MDDFQKQPSSARLGRTRMLALFMPATAARGTYDPLELRDISTTARKGAKASDFAGKDRSFPILKPADVAAAAKAMGRAGADNYSADKLKANIIRIAKRKGASFVAQLPKAWTSGEKAASRSIADVFEGRIELATAEDGKPRTSWIQLFKTGEFWDSRYGTFSITAKDLGQMLENFKTVMPEAPTRLPIDYNHGTSKPDTAEKGKAAGWIADLALRAAGEELWALIEWTDNAAEMIVAKEYQFVSPTFAYNYTHSNGEEIGTTLMAAAITNRPVLEGMEPLSLSTAGTLRLADAGAADGDEEAEGMFSFDEQRRRVQAALSEAFGVAYGFGDCGPCNGCYLVDLFDGRAVYREYDRNGSGDLYEVGFDITSAGEVHFNGSPVEVVADYRRLAAEEQLMAKTITVKDSTGKDVVLSEEVVLALAKDHAPAPAAGAAVAPAQFVELQQKVAAQDAQLLELNASNLALKKEAKERDITARVDVLVRAGKLTPADRAETITLGIEHTVAFDALEKQLAKRAPVVTFNQSTGSSEDGSVTSASDEAIALSRTEMEKDTKLDSAKAMEIVFRKNPELYARYTAETAVKV